MQDNVFNLFMNYLTNRSHKTQVNNTFSTTSPITASVVQGSVLGPLLFCLCTSEFHPKSKENKYFKYADDQYLIVPSNNSSSILDEVSRQEQWAKSLNLKLNVNKTVELVITKRGTKPPPEIPNIKRQHSVKVLGVTIDDRLSFAEHCDEILTSCNQSLYALKMLRSKGLQEKSIYCVFESVVLSKMLYAAPSWWGYINKSILDRLQTFLR